MRARFTVFESAAVLAKSWSVDEAGQLVKESAAQMVSGSYRAVFVETIAQFVDFLKSLTTHQALCTSLPVDGSTVGGVVTRANRVQGVNLARTKEDFKLSAEPGLLFIDSDDGQFSRDELWQLVCVCLPGAASSGAVWWPSGSSHIWHEGKDCTGLKGQHVYLLIDDASQTKRLIDTLAKRLWLKGYGSIAISAAGSLLVRCPVDTAPTDGARLIFAAGAQCEPPLTQRRGDPVVLSDGGFLCAASVPPLSADEEARYQALVAQAKAKAEPEARMKREGHRSRTIADQLPQLMKEGASAAEAEARIGAAVDAAFGGVLLGDFVLTIVHDDGRQEAVTVARVLSDRERWNEVDLLDPINPGHRGGAADCRLYLMGASPIAFSLDDGGGVYRLRRARETVTATKGNRSGLVEELARVVASSDGVFKTDAGPVLLIDGAVKPLTIELLMNFIGSVAAIVIKTPKGDAPQDVSREVAGLVLAALK